MFKNNISALAMSFVLLSINVTIAGQFDKSPRELELEKIVKASKKGPLKDYASSSERKYLKSRRTEAEVRFLVDKGQESEVTDFLKRAATEASGRLEKAKSRAARCVKNSFGQQKLDPVIAEREDTYNDIVKALGSDPVQRIDFLKGFLVKQEEYSNLQVRELAIFCNNAINGGRITANSAKRLQAELDELKGSRK